MNYFKKTPKAFDTFLILKGTILFRVTNPLSHSILSLILLAFLLIYFFKFIIEFI